VCYRLALPAGVDVARLGTRVPALLLSPAPGAAFAALAAELHSVLPPGAAAPAALAALLVAEPRFADVDAVRSALRELEALFPGRDAAALLASDPSLLASSTPPPPRRDPNDEYYV
jgi:hypothetical protein